MTTSPITARPASSSPARCLAPLLALLLGAACAGQGQPTAATTAPSAAPTAAPTAAAGCELLAEYDATFVLWDDAGGHTLVCDAARAATPFLPASTFKIVNALVALEEGVMPSVDETLPWDGVDRGMPAWNADASLRTGMAASTVWFYQELARRAGHDRMQAWVDALGYGNRDIGGPEDIDRFWLDGPLRVTALEQTALVSRLARRELPFSARSQDLVAEIMLRASSDDGHVRLYGKTGAASLGVPETGAMLPTDQRYREGDAGLEPTGWLIGWVEVDGAGFYAFAFNMRLRSDDDLPRREALARALLAANGVPLP
jgi:beta-lactamase class D